MLSKSGLRLLVMGCALVLMPVAHAVDNGEITDRVSFQVDVGTDVENDWLVAVLNVSAENKVPAKLANTINETMSWALQRVRGEEKIKSRSGSYRTFPVYDDKKIVAWRGRQELYLESRAVDELSQLLGTLQGRMQVQSLQFSVSPEVRARAEEKLVEQVLAAWQKRAAVITRALGSQRYELVDIAIHTGPAGPVIPLRAEMMSMKSAAGVSPPALESGTSRITVQASGSIRLVRDQ